MATTKTSMISSPNIITRTSVKVLAESPGLSSIPSTYTFPKTQHGDKSLVSDPEPHDLIPIIDLSLLISSSPEQRSNIIHDLGKACRDWGFFMVLNHGVPERVMKAMMDASERFFNLKEEEKREFEGTHVLDPIRYGTSFNASVENVFCWRDFVKFFVHPQFHSPTKPPELSEISQEYCKRTRKVARELLRGISESLGLEACYMDRTLNLDSGFQMLVANLYPSCPQPELAMGLPPHSDNGLLTLLTQNPIDGLQLQHNGKWINVNAPLPNSILALLGDQMEILSNGRYKSVVHRAVVNSTSIRMSIAIIHGPSFDSVVSPAQELVDVDGHGPAYTPINYKKYLEMQQSKQLDAKSCLDRVRI